MTGQPRRPSPDPSPLSEARVGRCSSAAYLDAVSFEGLPLEKRRFGVPVSKQLVRIATGEQ